MSFLLLYFCADLRHEAKSSVEFQWPCVDAAAFVCNLPSLFYYSADVFSADVCDELMVLVPSCSIFSFFFCTYDTLLFVELLVLSVVM